VGEPVAVDEPAGAPHEVGRGIQHVGHGVLLCSSVVPMVVRDPPAVLKKTVVQPAGA
jgi:hypothetical protein